MPCSSHLAIVFRTHTRVLAVDHRGLWSHYVGRLCPVVLGHGQERWPGRLYALLNQLTSVEYSHLPASLPACSVLL